MVRFNLIIDLNSIADTVANTPLSYKDPHSIISGSLELFLNCNENKIYFLLRFNHRLAACYRLRLLDSRSSFMQADQTKPKKCAEDGSLHA